MSAWIVSKAHIDLLVEAFFKYEIPTAHPLTPDELGHALWKENHRSINHRYEERSRAPRYQHQATTMAHGHVRGTYQPLGTVRDLARQAILLYKQCRCYGYQSCERPDWERSAVHGYLMALEQAILKGLGMDEETCTDHPDFDAAPWGID